MTVVSRPKDSRPSLGNFLAGAPDALAASDELPRLKGYALEAYPDQVAEIDVLRKRDAKLRRRPYSRNQWIRDAITEKLERDRQNTR